MTKKLVIANWKMNPDSAKEAINLLTEITKNISDIKKTGIVVCAPFVYLPSFAKTLAGKEKLKKISEKIFLGAQNVSSEEKGAFTGEISAGMLSDLGVKYVIMGHSERRAMGEDNLLINKKIKLALAFGLIPILCVGDKERDEHHGYFKVVKDQLEECLNGVKKDLIGRIVIAYEPVWALSTTLPRKDATATDSREMSVFIRKILSDKFGVKTKMPKIIYGGSVNDKNCEDFLTNGGVDGELVGAASLNAEKFLKIINIAESVL